MIYGKSKNSPEITRVFKTVKKLNEYIKAYELLFDVKPQIEVKGYFSTRDGLASIEWAEVSRVTSTSVYLKGEGPIAYVPDDEHCFAKLSRRSEEW